MKNTWLPWLISLLLTAICIFINHHFYFIENILQLEFAGSAERMQYYISTINQNTTQAYHILKYNTVWDYAFLLAYSLLTLFSFKLLFNILQFPLNVWVYILSFITGLLDAVENYFLLITANNQQAYFSGIYYWAVRIKWAFAIMNVLLILVVLVYGISLLCNLKATKK